MITSTQTPRLDPFSTAPVSPALTRQRREADEPADSQEQLPTTREESDSELAALYRHTLAKTNGHTSHDFNLSLYPVPAGSTFGQWWNQLALAFQSPDVVQWMENRGIKRNSITLNPTSGQISFSLKADPGNVIHTLRGDDPEWSAVNGPILEAGRVIVSGHSFATFSPPSLTTARSAPFGLVNRFYKEPTLLSREQIQQRVDELARDKTFIELEPRFFSNLHASRSEAKLEEQQALLGDIGNRYQAANDLRHLAGLVREGSRDTSEINRELKSRVLYMDPAGTYVPEDGGRWNSVSLLQFIKDHGWSVPTDLEQLDNLAAALSTPPPRAAVHGNYGGALAWPEPLDAVSEGQLRADIQGKLDEIDLTPFGSILHYLSDGEQISAEIAADPRRLIDTLIESPKGEALGKALQERFEARSVKGSANDWLLAALNLDLAAQNDGQTRIAGYTLLSAQNAGKNAATVLKELTEVLAKAGKGLSPELASAQATLLLSSRAPAFLVRDIPQDLVLGTHSWVSFTTAVARIEAQAPGATATMSYAQVMLHASIAPVSQEDARIESAAHTAALKDWAVANGGPYPVTEAEMADVRNAFAAQVNELQKASQASTAEMPTARGLALEQLKKALPDLDPKHLEEKSISVSPANRHFPGPYSILDLYLDGRGIPKAPDSADNWGETARGLIRTITFGSIDLPPDGRSGTWVSSSTAFDIADVLQKLKPLPHLPSAFEGAFSEYAGAIKTATAAQIKYLVSKLPLADRQNFEFGKVTIARENYYEWGGEKPSTEGRVQVKIERDGQIFNYQIDRVQGKITPRPDLGDFKTGEPYYKETRPFNEFKVITPEGNYPAGLMDETPGASGIPDSFGSARTACLADAILKDMDIPAVKKAAKGATTFDTEVPTHEKVAAFALNLIPFRSAIVNFQNGNTRQGFGDLFWDVFGFLVGFGTALKGAKGVAQGVSALTKVGQTFKIVGRAAVGALNPLSGVDDLARSVGNGLRKTYGAAYKGVKHLRGSYRNVNLLELAKKPDIAEGTYKSLGAVQENRVLAKYNPATDHWHAYDPRTRLAYGKPLEQFTADTSVRAAPGLISRTEPSLLNTGLSLDNVVQLGGTMQELKVIGSGMHTYVDQYKGTKRLNIIAHGEGPDRTNGYLNKGTFLYADNKPHDAKSLIGLLKSKGIDPANYDNVRLCACYSANGGSASFAQQFQKEINRPVKAFEGMVIANAGPEELNVLRERFGENIKKFHPNLPPDQAELMADMRYSQFHARNTTHILEKNNGGKMHIKVQLPDGSVSTKEVTVNYKPRHFPV